MTKLKYLMLLMPLTLAACGDGGPSKKEMEELFTSINSGDPVTVVQRDCTEHENKLYVCSVSFHFRKTPNNIRTEDDEFRKVNGEWETTWKSAIDRFFSHSD